MRIVDLIRFAHTPFGVFGWLRTLEFQCYTVERPWLNNTPWVSCIPLGDYDLVRGRFNKYNYECFELVGVPDRSEIKIHIANRAEQVQGCIAPGLGLGTLRDQWAVTSSTRAHKEWMAAMTGVDEAQIRIRALDTSFLYAQRAATSKAS